MVKWCAFVLLAKSVFYDFMEKYGIIFGKKWKKLGAFGRKRREWVAFENEIY